MLTVQALKRKLRESRQNLLATKTKYRVKEINRFKKRKQQQVFRLTKIVGEKSGQVASFEKEVRKLEAKCISLATELREVKARLSGLEKEHGKRTAQSKEVKDLKKEVRDLTVALDFAEVSEEEKKVEEKKVAVPIDTKKKSYDTSVRKVVYNCLSQQVAVESVGSVIKYAVSTLTGQQVSHVPSASTAAQMTREMGILSDLQVAEKLLSSTFVLAWDATTVEGKHLNQIHLNFPTETLTLNTQQLSGGKAVDYANHIISSLHHLASVYTRCNGGDLVKVLSTMNSKILSTLTDRAAANHATVTLLQERLNISLLELNCQIHPLDGLANAARSLLKKEDTEAKTSTKSLVFDCQAANVLHVISKLRYKANGDPGGFKAFLKLKGEKCGLFPKYVGNRLHVLFHLAGIVFCHEDLLLEFAEGMCALKKMSTGLRSDLRQPHILVHLQALGLMGKVLTGTWMALFYTDMKARNHFGMTAFLNTAPDNLKLIKENPADILSLQSDLFGQEQVIDDTLKALQQYDTNIDWVFNIIGKLALAFMETLDNQLKRYRKGPMAEPTENMLIQAESAPVHNIWAEQALGMMDAQCRRAPNATQSFTDCKVKAKVNGTLQWLEQQIPDKQVAIIKFAMEEAVSGRRRERQRQGEMEGEILRRIKEREQKKETADRNRLERKIREAVESGNPVTSCLVSSTG